SNQEPDDGKNASPCLTQKAPYKGLGAESEEKREPVSDIDTGVVVSLKVLDPDGRLEKRTNSGHVGMSALCQKRTYAPQQKAPLPLSREACLTLAKDFRACREPDTRSARSKRGRGGSHLACDSRPSR